MNPQEGYPDLPIREARAVRNHAYKPLTRLRSPLRLADFMDWTVA